jgi:pimeloyl-ACP methyl ester carboxylesterase
MTRCEATRVTTPDGLGIAVQQSGNPDGPEIVFIHGFSMGQLCWQSQVESHLAERFRLVTYDLRGHGASDKPLEPKFYREGPRWADELAAVLDHARVKRPVLVAWSYGVRIVADYLAHYGPGRVAGLNLVGSKTNSDPAFASATAAEHQRGMAFDDLAANIRHTIAFVEGCARSWDPDAFRTCLAMSMVVPHQVRAALMGRPLDIDDRFRSIEFPVHFSHGRFDGIIPLAAARHGHAITPGSTLSVFANSGHSPFMDEADRFNSELRDFVVRCV